MDTQYAYYMQGQIFLAWLQRQVHRVTLVRITLAEIWRHQYFTLILLCVFFPYSLFIYLFYMSRDIPADKQMFLSFMKGQ